MRSPAAPTASTSAVPAPAPPPAPPYDLAADLAARTRAARAVFGARTRTRVVGDVFLLAGPPSLGPHFDEAAALLARALPPLFDGRFDARPTAAVTVLYFASKAAYDAYVAETYGPMGKGRYGVYHQGTREIAADGSGGSAYVPTLTHEIVHPIVQADFPMAPLWLNEAVASVFEAPVFPADGGIRGERRNWRHDDLVAALASKTRRDEVHLTKLFAMNGVRFLAWRPDGGVDEGLNLLHCAMARELATWLDAQGELWPFYRAWRDGYAADPTGERSFAQVTGMTPADADAPWLASLR